MPINHFRIGEYLRQGEGAPPPVFVGQDDILEDILATAKDSAGQPKVTRIVQGAPGAGKTSLLHEMQKRWKGEDGTPRVVALSSTDIMDDPTVGVGAVLDAWTMDGKKWKRTLADRIERLRGVGIGPGGLSVQFSDAQVPGTLRMVAHRHPGMKHSGPIIVAIDESQRFAGGQTTPEARFLQAVHDGSSGLPLLLVLAGLSDTVERANDMHLTRGRRIHEVKPLTKAQAHDLMRRLAIHFGLDTSRHNPQLAALADICDGWPRHLRFAGVCLAEEALRMDGDMDRMDWSHVADRTWSMRQEYYSDQTILEMQQADILTARVMKGLKDGMHTRHMEELVENCRADRPGQRLPNGKDARWFIDRLIHQGALYRAPDGRVHSPIPSFRSYLIERGTEPEPRLTSDRDDNPDTNTYPSP